MQRKVPSPRWRPNATAAMFGFFFWLLSPVAAQDVGVTASGAWIREPPPGVTMLAGYFGVTNHSDRPVALIGARSARFGSVEMHETRIVDGVARMRPLARVDMVPGQTVDFEPGGRHLMLMHPVDAPEAGDCVVVTLVLEGGSEIDVRFQVRRE